jgi:hypothetical protein
MSLSRSSDHQTGNISSTSFGCIRTSRCVRPSSSVRVTATERRASCAADRAPQRGHDVPSILCETEKERPRIQPYIIQHGACIETAPGTLISMTMPLTVRSCNGCWSTLCNSDKVALGTRPLATSRPCDVLRTRTTQFSCGTQLTKRPGLDLHTINARKKGEAGKHTSA